MILLSIAFGMVGTMIVNAISSSGAGSSNVASAAAISRTLQAFESDLGNAIAPGRLETKIRDLDELKGVVQDHDPARSSDPLDAGSAVEFDDVLKADRHELQLRVDTDRQAGVECVAWTIGLVDGRQTVERTVYRAGGCGGAAIDTDTLVKLPKAVGGAESPAGFFRYQYGCNRSECPGSAPAGADCRPYTAPANGVPNDRRRWVVAVELHLEAMAQQGTSASQHKTAATASIRSRNTAEYRSALGC